MAFRKEQIEEWSNRLSFFVGIFVVLLSIFNDYSFLLSSVRGFGAFLILLFICKGSMFLWNECSSSLKVDKDISSTIDVLLGDLEGKDGELTIEELQKNAMSSEVTKNKLSDKPKKGNSRNNNSEKIAGQISKDVLTGLTDPKAQAEIVKKMGWGDK
ncbi:MAG: hypothetical protein WCR27_00340 [Eubacteriales bacterium]